jgi:multiple sugar transport system substrate-binding protein
MFTSKSYPRRTTPVLLCATLCLSAVAASGCSTPVPIQPATITFAYIDQDGELVEGLVEAFSEQYPQITVNLRPGDEYRVWHFDPAQVDVAEFLLGWFSDLQEQGNLMGLDPFIEADESFDAGDLYAGALESATIDGQIWGIPYGAGSTVVYYNMDLFDQYGVPYPEIGWTWDDFVDTATALCNPDAGVYGFASRDPYWEFMTLVHQHGGRIWDDIRDPTYPALDDPLNAEVLAWYDDLYENGIAHPVEDVGRTSFSARTAEIEQAVLAGKAGMWAAPLNHQGGAAHWLAEWPFRWNVITFPRSTGESAMDVDGALFIRGYAISSQTQHPEAAWQLVSFLSRQARPALALPVRRSVLESAEYQRTAGSDLVAVGEAVLAHPLVYSPRVWGQHVREILFLAGQASDRVQSGAMTPHEAIEWAQEQAEAIVVSGP